MDTERAITLAGLQEEFPGFSISREMTHSGSRYIARRRQPGTGLHTVITADPAELRGALAAALAEQRHGRRGCLTGLPAVPRQLPAVRAG